MTIDVAPAPLARPRRPRGRSRRRGARPGLKETLAGYGFLAPALLFFVVFLFIPVVLGVLLSFKHSSGFGVDTNAGFSNYTELFHDALFWKTVRNTAIYTALTVPTSVLMGLGIALVLWREMRGRTVYRTIIYFPVVISGIATGIVGGWMFNENIGFVDKSIISLGLSPISWQSHSWPAMFSLVVMTIWTRLGFNMVIYLAGLQNIDESYLEAARIEGANSWQRLWKVIWPLLGPTTFFLILLNVIYSFQAFDLIYIMTQGGPSNSTNTMLLYAYQQAFQNENQGYAAAIGIFLLFIVLIFTALQWRLSRNREVAG